MTDGHQKCVGKSILDGIVKFRKNRVEVQEDHQVNDQDHHKQYHKNLTDGARCAAADADVKIQQKSSHKHDQIDHNTLFQILFKGFKKSADNIRLFITNHFQSDVEHGGNGRSNGHHRNAADNAKQIQNDKICHPAHEGEKFVIHVEKTIHSKIPLFYFVYSINELIT
jgi:hypothetical protein